MSRVDISVTLFRLNRWDEARRELDAVNSAPRTAAGSLVEFTRFSHLGNVGKR